MAFTYEDGKQVFYGNGLEIPPEYSGFEKVSHAPWKCRYTFLTPSCDWFSPYYDDSVWETGFGPFGLKDGCVTPWSSRRLFVRYCFEVTDADEYSVLKVVVNDSTEFYLNGTYIACLEGSEKPQHLILPREYMERGSNLLAIKCFNDNRSENVIMDIKSKYE